MTDEEIINHLGKLTEKDVVYTTGEWNEIKKDKPLRIPMNKDMICLIIEALEKVQQLEEENIILKKEVLKFCESGLFSCFSCPLTDDCPMNDYKISIEQASNR